jgi:hypothetical protein
MSALAVLSMLAGVVAPEPPAFDFFAQRVLPVLRDSCIECHGARKQKGRLRVDSLAGLLKGGQSGAAVKVGDPDSSLIVQAIRYRPDADEQMPPKGKLPDQQIAELSAWVKMGAPWPATVPFIAPPPEAVSVPSTSLRRLTHHEYLRSLKKLTGVDTDKYMGNLPVDARINGFDNQAAALQVSFETMESYRDITADVVSRALKEGEGRFFPACQPLSRGCLPDAIARLGRRVFRRPLDDHEVRALRAMAVDARGRLLRDAAPALLEAMLLSPQFLFRNEVGEPAADRPGLRRLTDYEIASALSFALWSETPDDALLDAAEALLTSDPAWLAKQARTMLADPRADAAIESFAAQWLRIPYINTVPIAGTVPGFDILVRWGAEEQLRRLVRRYFIHDVDALDFLYAPIADVNDKLAKVYGYQRERSEKWREVQVDPDDDRKGFFGTAGFFLITSHVDRPSVILQGQYIRNALLCDSVGSPPPELADQISKDPAAQSSEARLSRQPCAGCHKRLDLIGRGLSAYNVIGARDADAPAASAQGTIVGFPDSDFSGPAALARAVAKTGQVPRCTVEHALAWLKGRGVTAKDEATIDLLLTEFERSGHRFKDMLASYVTSDDFLYREATP